MKDNQHALELVQLSAALGSPAVAIANIYHPAQAQTWLTVMTCLFGLYIVAGYAHDNVSASR